MKQASRLSAVALVAMLSACATPAEEYPSLAVRDAERITGTMDVTPTLERPPAPAPATLEALPQLVAEARAANTEFVNATPAARAVVSEAAGSARGTDSWSRAQVAVAGLEARRSRAMIALADLDRLFVASFTEAEDITEIEAARAEVDGMVMQQNAVVTELLARLAN